MIQDESRAALAGHVGPNPLDENANPKIGLLEELEVYRGPRQPGDEAVEAKFPRLQHGEPFADHRHAPLVEVAERPRRGLSGDTAVDQLPGVAPLLDRDLRDAGLRLAVLVERRGIAHNEDFRMSRHGQVRETRT